MRSIESFLARLLIHLIKNQVEQRLNNSWAASIRGSIRSIKKLNLQDNQTAYYIKRDEWLTLLEDEFEEAVRDASVEVFNGSYSPFQLSAMVDKTQVIKTAETLLSLTYDHGSRALPAVIDAYLTQLPGGDDWKLGRQ